MLANALASFVELMDHGIVSWDILETPFINMVASYVNNQTSRPQEAKVVQASLSILESIVLNSSAKYGQVEKEVGFPNLILRLENQNPIIQQNALSLINALFLKADPAKRKIIAGTLCTKQIRNVILQNIVQVSSGEVGSEMAHQLYVMQTLCFGLLEERMNTKMDPQDQDAHEKIKVHINIVLYIYIYKQLLKNCKVGENINSIHLYQMDNKYLDMISFIRFNSHYTLCKQITIIFFFEFRSYIKLHLNWTLLLVETLIDDKLDNSPKIIKNWALSMI